MELIQIKDVDRDKIMVAEKLFDICRVNNQKIDTLKELLDEGLDVLYYTCIVDENLRTLIHYISENCCVEMAKLLFDKMREALMKDAKYYRRKVEYVNKRMSEYMNIEAFEDLYINKEPKSVCIGTALHLACYSNNDNKNEMITLLIDNGADLCKKSYWGNVLISVLTTKNYCDGLWSKNISVKSILFILEKINKKFQNDEIGLKTYINETDLDGKTALDLYYEKRKRFIRKRILGKGRRRKFDINSSTASVTLKNILTMIQFGASVNSKIMKALDMCNYNWSEYSSLKHFDYNGGNKKNMESIIVPASNAEHKNGNSYSEKGDIEPVVAPRYNADNNVKIKSVYNDSQVKSITPYRYSERMKAYTDYPRILGSSVVPRYGAKHQVNCSFAIQQKNIKTIISNVKYCIMQSENKLNTFTNVVNSNEICINNCRIMKDELGDLYEAYVTCYVNNVIKVSERLILTLSKLLQAKENLKLLKVLKDVSLYDDYKKVKNLIDWEVNLFAKTNSIVNKEFKQILSVSENNDSMVNQKKAHTKISQQDKELYLEKEWERWKEWIDLDSLEYKKKKEPFRVGEKRKLFPQDNELTAECLNNKRNRLSKNQGFSR